MWVASYDKGWGYRNIDSHSEYRICASGNGRIFFAIEWFDANWGHREPQTWSSTGGGAHNLRLVTFFNVSVDRLPGFLGFGRFSLVEFCNRINNHT